MPGTGTRAGTGRTALVTGGARGLGLGIAEGLAALGFHVLVGARDAARGAAAVAALRAGGGSASLALFDVGETASIDAWCDLPESQRGAVTTLVNNAAIMEAQGGAGLETSMALMRRTFETNTLGPLRLIQRLVPAMRERGYGRIVNVSSDMGSLAHMGPDDLAYRVSKSALNALTHSLAAELRGTGVLLNAVHPGWVRTEMGGPRAARSIEEGADSVLWLATLPDDGPHGGFFHDRKPMAW